MPVPTNVAQRASSHRSLRLTAFALMAALVVSLGAMANPQQTNAASIKVVVVVGPVGSKTSEYKTSAKYYASIARSYGASVTEIYSPYATWSKVKAAAQGANLLIYLGHGNGYPSPYGAFQRYTKDGIGLNATVRQRQLERQVLGRVLHRPRHPDGEERRRDPEPPVLRLRQLGVGFREPDEVDRHEARGQLRCRVPAGRRQGRLRRGDLERRRTRSASLFQLDRGR